MSEQNSHYTKYSLRKIIRDRMQTLRKNAAREILKKQDAQTSSLHFAENNFLNSDSTESTKSLDDGQVLFWDVRAGVLHTESIKRLVLFFKGAGCSWAQTSGGCTFCGFWNATHFASRVHPETYLAQLHVALANLGEEFLNYPVVCLYNDGSFLAEEEMPLDSAALLLTAVAAHAHVRKVVIEAKVSDLSPIRIQRLTEALPSHVKLEIAVGFESANPLVRDLCVNKPFGTRSFEAALAQLQTMGVDVAALLLFKPPFLSEAQALADARASLCYLNSLSGISRIDLEVATIESHTLSWELWRQGLYTPPSHWSVIELLIQAQALGLNKRIYVSPQLYSVPALAGVMGCAQCREQLSLAIEHFNARADLEPLRKLRCSCKASWEQQMKFDEVNQYASCSSEQLLAQIAHQLALLPEA